MYVDSHCHLDFPGLFERQDEIVERARQAGVVRMVCAGTTRKAFDKTLSVAHKHPDVTCAVGVHPHHCEEEGERIDADELGVIAQDPKVVAIGETGLDYFYDTAPREAQQRNFLEHIRAARQNHLPLIVHSRQAEEDTIKALTEGGAGQGPALKGVLHCFSSRRMLAEAALDLGFYVSFSGILTFKKSQELREIARDIPLDRMLIETDAPYLAPEPHRGKICEPAYVTLTAKVLAQIKEVSVQDLARQTTENFFRLFDKVAPLSL